MYTSLCRSCQVFKTQAVYHVALLYLVIFLCRQFQMMLMLMESNPQLASALGRGFSAFSQEIERLEKGKELEVLTPVSENVEPEIIDEKI